MTMKATIRKDKDGEVLVIEAPLSKGHLSSSGKNYVQSTTNGFTAVEGVDGMKFSLNVIKNKRVVDEDE